MPQVDLEEWNKSRESLRGALTRIVGLTRLEKDFDFQSMPLQEERDPAQEKASKVWPEYKKGSRYNRCFQDRIGERFRSEKVRFPGIENDIVGILRTPKLAGKAFTVALCLHGHSRGCIWGKEITDYYAVELSNRGFVTFSPDAYLFGERRDRQYDQVELESGGRTLFYAERLAFVRSISQGGSLLGLHLSELIRCIDFLDMLGGGNNRILVMGHSMGGIFGMWLGALDERISAVICAAGLLSYSKIIQYNVLHCFSVLVPSILKICDTPKIVALIPPRALYAVHGKKDAGFPIDGVQEVVADVQNYYRAYGAEGNCVSIIEDTGHNTLTRDALNEIITWLKHQFMQSK